MGIGRELSAFFQAILAGNVVCLVYYALRVFRRIVKHHLFVIAMEDIIFWIGTGIYLFVRIFQTCDGMVRWHFVVGALLGSVATCCISEKIMKKYLADFEKKR